MPASPFLFSNFRVASFSFETILDGSVPYSSSNPALAGGVGRTKEIDAFAVNMFTKNVLLLVMLWLLFVSSSYILSPLQQLLLRLMPILHDVGRWAMKPETEEKNKAFRTSTDNKLRNSLMAFILICN